MVKYFAVPMLDGILDIDYLDLVSGVTLSKKEAFVCLRNNPEPRESWQSITEEDFRQYVPEVEPNPPKESVEDKLARLEGQNLILMDALATTFEELIALRELVEGGTK